VLIDAVAVALFGLLVVRGWIRGFVREAIDVGTLVLGAVLAFRLAPPAGRLLSGAFGVSPDLARLIGGAVLFIGIAIGASLLGALINKSVKHLPGLSTLNRIGGVALGAVYAAILVVIAVTLMAAAPLPDAVADQFDESRVVEFATRPDGIAQRAVGAMTGDRALQSMIWIRGVVGGWAIDSRVTDVTLPGGSAGRPSSEAAQELFADINRARSDSGLSPLAWSDDVALVALDRALEVSDTGSLAPRSPITDRLDAAGIGYDEASEYLILAPTVDGLGDVAGDGDGFTTVGIGVVDGPYGLIAAVILTR